MESSKITSAQFIDTFYPNIDGVVRTVHNYATLMNSISDCCVVAPRPMTPFEDRFPYEVIRTDSIKIPFVGYGYPLPELSRGVKARICGGKYDIYHAHSPFSIGNYALKLARDEGKPVVATFHSKYYDDFKRITGSELMARQVVKKIVEFYEDVDSVWAVSSGTADTLFDYGYKGSVFVINNGTDYSMPDDPDAARAAARARFGIPEDKKIILFVGHQIWQKNLKLVLDTMRKICSESDDYRLVVVGCGYAEKQIHDYSDSLGLVRFVNFVGQISDADLLKGIHLCADLYFVPSIYANSPLVLRETAAMGVPALLVRGSNSAECVRDGENGYLAEATVKDMVRRINEIFADDAARLEVGKRAQQTIPVRWETLIPQVMDKYAEVLERYANGRK